VSVQKLIQLFTTPLKEEGEIKGEAIAPLGLDGAHEHGRNGNSRWRAQSICKGFGFLAGKFFVL
jgi:hypothetical protein